MPDIAVFRVSSKTRGGGLKLVTLLLILFIGVVWLLNKACNASITSIKLQSLNIIQSTNSLVLKGFVNDMLPVFKHGSGSEQKAEISEFNGISVKPLSIDLFSSKSILNAQYPILQDYYLKNIPKTVSKDISEDISKDISQGEIQKAENILQNEEETDSNQQKEEPIYKSSTVVKSGGIGIKNHTSVKVDIEKLKGETLKITKAKKKPEVLILHTHTSEAYSTAGGGYNSGDTYRTKNPNYSVVRVGKELEAQLSKLGIKTYHDTTVHDYPAYVGSYKRSLQTAQKDIKKYPSVNIVLDIHRDALGDPKENLKTVAQIGNTKYAKIMFVVGTNQMGLEHPGWMANLAFAIKLEDKANKLYPGLCKEIDLRKERFNQHVAPGAIIVEVGATGNTLEEADASMKCLARVIAEVIK